MLEERLADIADPRKQIEAVLGVQLYEYQWDYLQHLQKGERLVTNGRGGYFWAKQEPE